MTSLQEFALLQSRVLAFVAAQDDTTVRAIIAGSARLAVLRDTSAADTPRPAPADLETMTVRQLRDMAKDRGHHGYSGLRRSELLALLRAGADEPTARAPEVTSPAQLDSRPAAETPMRPLPRESADPAEPSAAAAEIAARLRELSTEDEGVAYLAELGIDREGLLAVAVELRLTRVERVSTKELRRLVLRQAIGTRRKFAGLRDW